VLQRQYNYTLGNPLREYNTSVMSIAYYWSIPIRVTAPSSSTFVALFYSLGGIFRSSSSQTFEKLRRNSTSFSYRHAGTEEFQAIHIHASLAWRVLGGGRGAWLL